MTDAAEKPFLDSLTEAERGQLTSIGRPSRYGPGEAIFHQGDDPGGVIAVLKGRVKVSISRVGGREVVVTFPGPGDLVGELAAIGGRPRTANMTAVGKVEALATRRRLPTVRSRASADRAARVRARRRAAGRGRPPAGRFRHA